MISNRFKTYFATFANSTYGASTSRITEQAKSWEVFDDCIELSEFDISGYISKHINFISKNPQGFGLWIWKPAAVEAALARAKDGDVLVYCDAGV